MASKEEAAASLSFEQLKELLSVNQQGKITPEQIAEIAATAAAKAKMPENKQHPGKSVYSHPEGEVARPKAKLKCRMYLGGGPIEARTCTPSEIEALNLVTPGHFHVRTADRELTDPANKIIEVKGQYDANQQLEKLFIIISAEDPDKHNYGSIARLAKQLVAENRVQTVAA